MQELFPKITNKEAITNLKWFAIYTKSKCEKKVFSILQTQGYSAFLPTYSVLRQWSDRKKRVTEPLIKRIVFVALDPLKINDIYQINHITGIVKEFGKPAEIKEKELRVLEMIAREWEGETIVISEQTTFDVGDDVIIEKGPFTGLTGELIEVNGKHRLVVKLQTLQVEFTINIPKSHTRKCNATTQLKTAI